MLNSTYICIYYVLENIYIKQKLIVEVEVCKAAWYKKSHIFMVAERQKYIPSAR